MAAPRANAAARRSIITSDATAGISTSGTGIAPATLRARSGGYIIDMVIFGAVAMIMLVIAGFVLLASTDWAQEDRHADSAVYAFLLILGIGTPLVWTLMNIGLLATRGQTGGQYVAGVALRRERGERLSLPAATGWWFCFNPLLFSWPMALVSSLPFAFAISLLLSRAVIFAFGIVLILCLACPIIALVSAWFDGQHRALHDRVIGTVAVPSAS